MNVTELTPGEYHDFYQTYTRLVPENLSPVDAKRAAGQEVLDYLRQVDPARGDYAYAPGKWTIKESLQHIIDTERIFATRLLRLLRGDQSDQPGFDQNEYAEGADVRGRGLPEMVREFELLDESTRLLVGTMVPATAQNKSQVSGGTMSARAMAYIICGHLFHHAALFRERYQ